MADAGHVQTDKILAKLEKQIAKEYATAVTEMQAKLEAYLQKTEDGRKKQESLLNAGKITKKEFSNWCYTHEMVGKRWEDMVDVLTSDMTHANEIAKGIMQGTMPDIYALNANYGAYQIEHGGNINTGFTLYNHDTAQYLLGDQRQLMPKPSKKKAAEIKANPDMQWNRKKIQSAVLQGVLQGEAPHQVADRLMTVGQMNYNAAVRYARTMGTSAQNAGRYEAYRRASNLGVDLTIEWSAILDHRTRHAHRMMHGQRTEVDKPFYTPDGYTIYYPADCTGTSNAPQKEIWNCRCTLLSWVKGFEGDTVKDAPGMDGMTFDEWQNAKPYSDTEADKQQFEKYKQELGKEAPKTFADFQKLKYGNDPAQYEELKTKYYDATHPVVPPPTTSSPFGNIAKAVATAQEFDEYEHERDNFDWDTWNALTREEQDGIKRYTGSSYYSMNSTLRRGTFDQADTRTQDYIVGCTEGLSHFSLAEDTILFRGMGDKSTLAGALGITENELADAITDGSIEGMRFCERGFCSTGISQSAGWSKDVSLQITAPKGTCGMYVDPISLNQGEMELLLQQGTWFEILQADTNMWGNIEMQVVVVDQTPRKF